MLKRALLLIMTVLGISTGSVAQAAGIYYQDAFLSIELSETVEGAIDGGIALTFESEFAHIRRFLFISWPKKITSHKFNLTLHALSNRYLVTDGLSLTPAIFRSKREALAFITNETLALFKQYRDQDISNSKSQQMRLSLSVGELPSPLRLSAFINKEWDLDSGWNRWQFAQ